MLEFELLQIALGNRDSFSKIPSADDWEKIFKFAKDCSILGFTFPVIEKLPKDQIPSELILMQWVGYTGIIKQRNILLNQRSSEIVSLLHDDGLRSVILKGQANYVTYPHPYLRSPGDIDIWVEGSRQDIVKYVSGKVKNK